MSEIRLSIVTVTRNNRVGLTRTLNSVISQRAGLEAAEVIVVDGASSDGTVEYLSELSMRNLRWSSEPDRNVYDAMNKGMRTAVGDYQLYMNAGDIFADDHALEAILAIASSNPPWIVGGAVNLSAHPPIKIQNIPHRWIRHALGLQPHCHQSTVFSRQLMTVLGGYSEDFGLVGDFDLIMRAGMVAEPAILERVIAAYEGGGMSAARDVDLPAQIAAVRRSRMQMPKYMIHLDGLFVRGLRLRRKMGIGARLRGLRRGSAAT